MPFSRRVQLATALAAAGLTLGLASLATPTRAARADASSARPSPNIVLILVDDLGFTDIGAYGSAIETPNLDALAARGVRFSDFHTSVSGPPSRSMLMTGTDNHVAGLGNAGELLTERQRGKPGYEGHLNDRVVTLPEVLRAAGYHTYMAGKWHLGSEPEQRPHARGFERSFSMLEAGASHWGDRVGLQAKAQPFAKYSKNGQELKTLPGDFYSTRSYADFLIEAIREQRGDGSPFFAYYAPTAVHDPIHVPEPWLSKYRGLFDDGYGALKLRRIRGAKKEGIVDPDAPAPGFHERVKPWGSLTAEEQAYRVRVMEAYAGFVENLDYHVGRLVRFLQDIGEYDDTLIVFTSDNGPNPWDPDEYPSNAKSKWLKSFDNGLENIGKTGSFVGIGTGWANASAGPLDYFKLTVGEGGIRTPLVVAGPGIEQSRVVHSFAYVTDVMPTLLAWAGVAHPTEFRGRQVAPMRGRSLAAVITGEAASAYGADEFVGGEMMGGKWMRRGDIKAVQVAPPYGTGEWRLYDTRKDPGETQDLSAQQPELLKTLVDAWQRYADEVGVVAGN